MILVQRDRDLAWHVRLRARLIDDEESFGQRESKDTRPQLARFTERPAHELLVALKLQKPRVQLAQARMMRPQLADLLVGAQDETRKLGEAGQVGAGMRGGEKRDAARVAGNRLPSFDTEARRMPQDLLCENPAHTVCDEDDRPLADPLIGERLEDRRAPIGKRHRLAGPGRHVGPIAKRPDANVREIGSDPRGPEALRSIARPPRRVRASAQPVDEHDVADPGRGLAVGKGGEALVVAEHRSHIEIFSATTTAL